MNSNSRNEGFHPYIILDACSPPLAYWALSSELDMDVTTVRGGRCPSWARAPKQTPTGASFLALAAYIVVESVTTLRSREAPDVSPLGLGILVLSVLIMPAIAHASRRVARALGSRALEADAAQTSLCAYLSVIALAGVGLNAAFGWWWADPAAALVMSPIIVKEGLEGVRGEGTCEDCARS